MRAPVKTRRRDDGLTSVELLLASAMAITLLTAVATVIIGVTQATRDATVRAGNSRQVRGATEVITASLRVGVRPDGIPAAVVTAKPSEISFYSLMNRTGASPSPTQAPTLVRYWWDSTTKCLMQSRVVGTPLTTPLPSGVRWDWSGTPVQRCAMTTTTPPAFRYFDRPQLTEGGSTVADLGSSSLGLNQATRATIRSVEVSLVAQDPNDTSVNGSTVLDRVTLNNAS